MSKFEPSQKDESGAKQTDSSQAVHEAISVFYYCMHTIYNFAWLHKMQHIYMARKRIH